MSENTKSVFVSIIGRANVGKSSILNALIGEKAAIVTPKPQTTRTKITGILTKGAVQYVFFDTPGIHAPRTKLGKKMAQTTADVLSEGDVTLMLFEPKEPLRQIELEMMQTLKTKGTALAVINKADTVKFGQELMLKMEEIKKFEVFKKVLISSATTKEGCEELLSILGEYAVNGPHFFEDDAFTDQPEKQLVAEILREQLLLFMQEEIPHGTAVEIDLFKERPRGNIIDIEATIYCEKKSHKGMIIGKDGTMLKKIASAARQGCEELLLIKVNLKCWVKVRDGWRDDENLLNRMGFK